MKNQLKRNVNEPENCALTFYSEIPGKDVNRHLPTARPLDLGEELAMCKCDGTDYREYWYLVVAKIVESYISEKETYCKNVSEVLVACIRTQVLMKK